MFTLKHIGAAVIAAALASAIVVDSADARGGGRGGGGMRAGGFGGGAGFRGGGMRAGSFGGAAAGRDLLRRPRLGSARAASLRRQLPGGDALHRVARPPLRGGEAVGTDRRAGAELDRRARRLVPLHVG